MTSFDPQRPDFAPYGFTCVRWRPSAMTRPDRHNEIEINFLRSGALTYLLRGRKVRIPAQHLGVFWAAMPHQIIDFEDTTEYFVATLPLAWFIQCRLPEPLVQSLLQGEVILEALSERADSDLQMLAHWETDLLERAQSLKKAVLLELEARLLRLAHSSVAPQPGRRVRQRAAASTAELTKVEKMACYIAQSYTQTLTSEDVGQHVGLHPNYAMGLFKRTIGTTIVDYVTQHRVSHAQRLLATTDTKIVDVALNSGFASTSRFNAAFRQQCGCSPRDYRRQHRLQDA